MGKILSREKEIEVLDGLMVSKEAEFVAVYGRRRIGKTYLIQNYFEKSVIFFSLTGTSGGSKREQLRGFPSALQRAFSLGKRPALPEDWWQAFEMLEDQVLKYSGKKKIVIFFDELPWLAGKRPFMLRALEHSWNSCLSHKPNVIMVLCGSAAAWMIKKIVKNTKGLYGRITQKIPLQPFTLPETSRYLKAKGIRLDTKQLIEIFMVTGGVAKYLNKVLPGHSSAETIQNLCFSQHGLLREEFSELFDSLFDNPERHLGIIHALASAHYGLTHLELSKMSNIPSGGWLKAALDELEASGFITSVPYFGKKKRFAKYRIIDEYTLFYMRWIHKGTFVDNRPISETYWMSQQITAEFNTWSGYAFENLCLKHTDLIIETLKISVVAKGVSYWNYKPQKSADKKGAQIDLIIERRDRSINLCEIKFCKNLFTVTSSYSSRLTERREIFREATGYKGSLFNTLITPFGSKKNTAYHSSVDGEINLSKLLS